MATNNETKPKNLNAVNLKEALWETLQGLQKDTIEPGKGDAIATQAREILRTVNTQLKVSSVTGRKVTQEVIDFSEGN